MAEVVGSLWRVKLRRPRQEFHVMRDNLVYLGEVISLPERVEFIPKD